MSNVALGVLSFGILLGLLVVRIPIGVAMAAVGGIGFVYLSGLTPFLAYLKQTPWEVFANYSLSVIPLFLLMGNFAARSGLSANLYRAANGFLGHYRGGLAMSSVGACAAFGTICGSSLATAATMGRVALPEMRKYGYSGALATGSIAAGGTLGILIPPSVVLVIYAILTQQNIAKMFLAAAVPALLAVIGFMIAVRLYLALSPDSGPPSQPIPWRERFARLASVWPVVVIFLAVFVGMNGETLFGRALFTPTEGAAVGAFGTCLAALTYGHLRPREIVEVLKDTAVQTAMIFLILLGADFYNAFLARTQMPIAAGEWIAALGLAPIVVMIVIVALYLVLGAMMDSLSMILLTIPIFFPIVMALDFGLTPEETAIWFGIVILIVVELGLITPPVGLNVYIINGLAKDVPMWETFKGASVFLAAEIVRVALLIAFPALTLWLVT
ncbi:TRAP transporter large permease [Salinarimonas rosea]|uniref:TRAP transporter large permease n=1 Tax=Salinarimonas rosea TaxID=552063 RepID=UPI000425D7BC|nr:TRAP transporter large permease [Salinarimonas rosea]